MRALCNECFQERRRLTEPRWPACKADLQHPPVNQECDCGEPAVYNAVFFMNGEWQ